MAKPLELAQESLSSVNEEVKRFRQISVVKNNPHQTRIFMLEIKICPWFLLARI